MAGYVQKTLAADEEIVYRANFNWTYSFGPVFWFLLGLSPIALIAYAHFVRAISADELAAGWWLASGAGIVGFLILFFHFVVLWTTEIMVTTYRFVYKKGLVSRSSQEVSLNKIEEITLNQSIMGRIFGYGMLIMRGTGVGVIELPAIDNPIRVRQIIENTRSKLRRSATEED